MLTISIVLGVTVPVLAFRVLQEIQKPRIQVRHRGEYLRAYPLQRSSISDKGDGCYVETPLFPAISETSLPNVEHQLDELQGGKWKQYYGIYYRASLAKYSWPTNQLLYETMIEIDRTTIWKEENVDEQISLARRKLACFKSADSFFDYHCCMHPQMPAIHPNARA